MIMLPDSSIVWRDGESDTGLCPALLYVGLAPSTLTSARVANSVLVLTASSKCEVCHGHN